MHPDPTVVPRAGQPVSDLDADLARVAPRLRALRDRRGLTLRELSDGTGISTSTLSRLETGQRRPSLELLLPLARVYRVPLDELVGAPQTGDPRVRLQPRRANGRVVVPLTRHPAEQQAWKVVIPRVSSEPELRSHAGYEWMYVLSGRVRLILGTRDLVLEAGEVAEFDTTEPHWFGSTGEDEAEILSLFGAQGARVHAGAGSPASDEAGLGA